MFSCFPACCYAPNGYGPYHGQSFHQHELHPWKGCSIVYTLHQQGSSYGTLLLSSPFIRDRPWSGNFSFNFILCPSTSYAFAHDIKPRAYVTAWNLIILFNFLFVLQRMKETLFAVGCSLVCGVSCSNCNLTVK